MSDRALQTLKTWLTIGGTIAAIAFAWSQLSAQAQRLNEVKADKAEVENLRQLMIRVDERTARIERHLCRQRPQDLGC